MAGINFINEEEYSRPLKVNTDRNNSHLDQPSEDVMNGDFDTEPCAFCDLTGPVNNRFPLIGCPSGILS